MISEAIPERPEHPALRPRGARYVSGYLKDKLEQQRALSGKQRLRLVRAPLIILGIGLALMLVIRLILDPVATHETRKALDQMNGFRGDFARVHVTLFGPGYEITKLKLVETARDSGEPLKEPPLLYVERAHLGISWRDLLHGKVVAALRLEHPKINIVQAKTPAKATAKKAPDLSAQLQKIAGVKVDRVEVFGGEVAFRESGAPAGQELWLHRLELTAQNLATRAPLAKGRPATVSASGLLGRSGELTLFVSADPFANPLSFAGQTSVVGFRAVELSAFLEPKAHLQPKKGTIDVFAEFVSKNGMITGGVKPVLKNIDIGPTDPGLWNHLKAWLADKTVEIASDRVPERNAVATTIPIKGKLTDPETQLWPTVLGVIRNAFVRGLESGFANVPPATAEKKEGAVVQAKNALKKDEGPPKAQPVKP